MLQNISLNLFIFSRYRKKQAITKGKNLNNIRSSIPLLNYWLERFVNKKVLLTGANTNDLRIDGYF
jgi:hypothetical protein